MHVLVLSERAYGSVLSLRLVSLQNAEEGLEMPPPTP